MNAKLQRPPEGDFHAYVDGRLEPARRGELELWLDSHADDAQRDCLASAQGGHANGLRWRT